MHMPMDTASRGLSVNSKRPHLSGCLSTGNALSFTGSAEDPLAAGLLQCREGTSKSLDYCGASESDQFPSNGTSSDRGAMLRSTESRRRVMKAETVPSALNTLDYAHGVCFFRVQRWHGFFEHGVLREVDQGGVVLIL